MTAKELFLRSQDAKICEKFLPGLAFQCASEAALLTLTEDLCTGSNDVNSAAANHFRLEGARRVLLILRSIAKQPEVTKREQPGQLKNV